MVHLGCLEADDRVEPNANAIGEVTPAGDVAARHDAHIDSATGACGEDLDGAVKIRWDVDAETEVIATAYGKNAQRRQSVMPLDLIASQHQAIEDFVDRAIATGCRNSVDGATCCIGLGDLGGVPGVLGADNLGVQTQCVKPGANLGHGPCRCPSPGDGIHDDQDARVRGGFSGRRCG